MLALYMYYFIYVVILWLNIAVINEGDFKMLFRHITSSVYEDYEYEYANDHNEDCDKNSSRRFYLGGIVVSGSAWVIECRSGFEHSHDSILWASMDVCHDICGHMDKFNETDYCNPSMIICFLPP